FLGVSNDAEMLDAIKWKNSNNPSDREFATDILADIGTAEATGDLRTMSGDTDSDVAGSAQADLQNVRTPLVFPTVYASKETQ
ncbi:MAG: hypothetical protein ACRD3S_14075, partial [Terracidiphilus sp.]